MFGDRLGKWMGNMRSVQEKVDKGILVWILIMHKIKRKGEAMTKPNQMVRAA